MKILPRPIIILLLVIAAAGCSFWGRVDRDLVGTEWRLVELNGRPPIPTRHKEITIKITNNGLQGYGGCNQFGKDGKFFMRSGKLSIKSIVSTAKSCGAEIDEQETDFYRALRNSATYRVHEGRLELDDRNGKSALLFERVDDVERRRTSTPALTATLPAYHPGLPISSREEAISAALAYLNQSRLHYRRPPQVIFVEKMKAADAHRRLREKGVNTFDNEKEGTTRVWLVIFQGAWQVLPPDPSHSETPPPLAPGCVYVIMDARDGGEAALAGIDCDP